MPQTPGGRPLGVYENTPEAEGPPLEVRENTPEAGGPPLEVYENTPDPAFTGPEGAGWAATSLRIVGEHVLEAGVFAEAQGLVPEGPHHLAVADSSSPVASSGAVTASIDDGLLVPIRLGGFAASGG